MEINKILDKVYYKDVVNIDKTFFEKKNGNFQMSLPSKEDSYKLLESYNEYITNLNNKDKLNTNLIYKLINHDIIKCSGKYDKININPKVQVDVDILDVELPKGSSSNSVKITINNKVTGVNIPIPPNNTSNLDTKQHFIFSERNMNNTKLPDTYNIVLSSLYKRYNAVRIKKLKGLNNKPSYILKGSTSTQISKYPGIKSIKHVLYSGNFINNTQFYNEATKEFMQYKDDTNDPDQSVVETVRANDEINVNNPPIPNSNNDSDDTVRPSPPPINNSNYVDIANKMAKKDISPFKELNELFTQIESLETIDPSEFKHKGGRVHHTRKKHKKHTPKRNLYKRRKMTYKKK